MSSQLIALGLVGGLLVAKVPQKLHTKAEVMATKATLASIELNIQLYSASEDGAFNTSDAAAFVRNSMKRKDGKAADQDSWGHNIKFSQSRQEIVATSAGPDGVFGTADDITQHIDLRSY